MKEYKKVSLELWESINAALGSALDDLGDASSVVDPGEDENRAYGATIEMIEEVLNKMTKVKRN